jgi:VIT1/CCC1 family predicted Fe2+/Mn2+ transporter
VSRTLPRGHREQHFTGSEAVRDVVIGMSDGLTVPFALAAGISGAVAATGLVVTAGMAEIAAGSIAMGLGGYLAARSDAEHYQSERRREHDEVRNQTHAEEAEVLEALANYGVSETEAAPVVAALRRDPDKWVDFMMRFELGLEEPDPKTALASALRIGGSYVVGGLIPLAPYFFFKKASPALLLSVVGTLFALTIFGYVKGRFTGVSAIKSALQTVGIGGVAATVAFLLARLFSHA